MRSSVDARFGDTMRSSGWAVCMTHDPHDAGAEQARRRGTQPSGSAYLGVQL